MSVALGYVNNRDSDVYFKLVSKQILMIVQVPCKAEMKRRLELSQKVPIVYYKYDTSMVHPSSDHLIKRYFEKVSNPVPKLSLKPKSKFSKAVTKNSMKHVYSAGMLSLQLNDLSAFVAQNTTLGRKKSRDFTQRKRTTS